MDQSLDEITTQLFDLWDILKNFVENFLTNNQDKAHDSKHAKRVATTSIQILYDMDTEDDCDLTLQLIKDVITVAWLHDIADHKKPNAEELKQVLREILTSTNPNPKLMESIIDRISFSREDNTIKTGSPYDWSIVLGPYGCLIRNIVSDADKLDAIGKTGLERCMDYKRYTHKRDYGTEVDHDSLVQHVKKHANDKLLRLKDGFIRTEPGKRMAIPLHNEFVQGLAELDKQKN